jgi:hypothetical protein
VEEKARAALERLPADQAAFIGYVQGNSRPATHNAERAQSIATDAAGDELHLFLGFCEARARRLVAGNFPLFELLLPIALDRPILNGEAVEQAIATTSGKEGS